ncbi:MAG: hypothetical protein DRJ66_02670 [Thermoprotei archaeon]|nr:MAG: hypothetical protein DRJ66_02670 [Thermoprotei archaeon]RLF20342.1 MAG: hypothetical protein DRZ82_02730 [Thermoprotei archaeon]
MSVKEKVSHAIQLINTILSRANLEESDKNALLQVKRTLLEIEADLIGIQHICELVISDAIKLGKYFKLRFLEGTTIPRTEEKSSLKEYILRTWQVGQVMTSKDLTAIIGDEKKAKEILEELLKAKLIRIAKAEWNEGEVIVHYERIA